MLMKESEVFWRYFPGASICRLTSLKIILFFAILTITLTAGVVYAWEVFLMSRLYNWVEARYPGPENKDRRWRIAQRIEHFFISITVDVVVVTLLLRMVDSQQRHLRESQGRYAALFEHANDGISIVAVPEGRLIEVNPKFGRMLGCDPTSLVGRRVDELMRPEGALSDMLAGASGQKEVAMLSSRGDAIPASVSFNSLPSRQGNLAMMIMRDLSERKRIEAEKEEIQRQLFQSSKLASIGELSAGVAHEINNPINCIINLAQLLKDEGAARTQSELQIINGIIDEGERIARIVRDLLTFARQDEHQLGRVDVAETIRNSLSLFGRQLEKEGIRVEVEVEQGLPPVMADGLRLRQVIVNMISNARHALAAKRSEHKLFRISARAAERDDKRLVLIEFFDNGVGIPPENLDKVFDPFFTTRRDMGGTGLGLSLSFGIIRSYGGAITVESRHGEYTRFVARLPAATVTKYASGAAC